MSSSCMQKIKAPYPIDATDDGIIMRLINDSENACLPIVSSFKSDGIRFFSSWPCKANLNSYVKMSTLKKFRY